MGNVDKGTFEGRGARGFGDSDYSFCTTSCCGATCVEDIELSDLYFDATSLAAVCTLLTVDPRERLPCPICGAESWDLRPTEDLRDVPAAWQWAFAPRSK